jgi:hypothetical protein
MVAVLTAPARWTSSTRPPAGRGTPTATRSARRGCRPGRCHGLPAPTWLSTWSCARRRDGDTPADLATWETVVEKPIPGRYGSTGGSSTTPSWCSAPSKPDAGLYSADELLVHPNGRDLPTALADAVDRVVMDATTRGRRWTPIPARNASPADVAGAFVRGRQ